MGTIPANIRLDEDIFRPGGVILKVEGLNYSVSKVVRRA